MDYLIQAHHSQASITVRVGTTNGLTQQLVCQRTIAIEPMLSMTENITDFEISNVASAILERYHFQPLDEGYDLNDTPLAHHERGVNSLAERIRNDFGLPDEEIREFLKEAIDEVF